MSDHHTHGDSHHHDNHDHGSLKSYAIGFILSVILTAIPFGLVMFPSMPKDITIMVVVALAVIQVVVHLVYFLHMNTKSEGGWNMMALIFTIMIVGIAMAGSLWVMYHMNHNMMPDLMPEYMHTKTAP
ncbi:MAG: cytochrome o ubiquinol oxidase subunit IV [Janthinobacterium sp.]